MYFIFQFKPCIILSRSKLELELKQYFDNKTIWQDSFWVYRNRILPCLTLNHPIEKLTVPDDISVRKLLSS